MSHKIQILFISIVILLLLFTAPWLVGRSNAATLHNAASQSPTPTTTPTQDTASSSPSPTQSPIGTKAKGTPSATPASTPVRLTLPTSVPVSWGRKSINATNANHLSSLAYWGEGVSLSTAYAAKGSVYIQNTPYGTAIYRTLNLQLVRFIPDAQEFFLSPDEDVLFTRLPDGKIQVLHLPEAEIIFTFEPIATLSPWMKDQIYHQLPKDRPAYEKLYFEEVSRIAASTFSPDKRLVAIGFGDASIGLWDLSTGKLVRTLKSEVVKDIDALVFSPNGEVLLSTGESGDTAVWKVMSGRLQWRLLGIGHIVGQPFSKDGSLLVLETSQGSSSWVTVRNSQYGDEIGKKVVGVVASQAISPDNTRLVTTWYNTVTIWTIPGLRQVGKINSDLSWPHASFSADGSQILLNEGERVYNFSDLSLRFKRPGSTSTPTAVPENQLMVATGHLSSPLGLRFPQPGHGYAWGTMSDTIIWVYDLARAQVTMLVTNSPMMASPDLSPNADRIAVCTQAGLLQINTASGEIRNLGRCRSSGVVRFSTDGKTIFRANGSLIDAVDSKTGDLRYTLRSHTFLVENIEVTSDGKYLVSSSNFQRARGRELIWWQLDQPKHLRTWMVSVNFESYLLAAAVDTKEAILYTALGGLRAWRLGDGLQHQLDTTGISSLAISPDSRLIAIGDNQGNIHIRSLKSGEELVVLSGYRQAVTHLVFAPNNTSLLSASSDGIIHLWGVP